MKKKAEKERNLLDQKFADLRQLIILGGAGERALLFDMQKILEDTEEQGELYGAVNGNTEEICTISRGYNPSCSIALPAVEMFMPSKYQDLMGVSGQGQPKSEWSNWG